MLLVISYTIEDCKDVFHKSIDIEPDQWPYPKVLEFVRSLPGRKFSRAGEIHRLSDPTDPRLVYQIFFAGNPGKTMLIAQFHVENPSGETSSWGEFANYIISKADTLPAYVIATMVTGNPINVFTRENVAEVAKMILDAYESGDMME